MKSLMMPTGLVERGQGGVLPSQQQFLTAGHSLPTALHPCSGLGLCRHCCSGIMKPSQRNPAPGLIFSMRWKQMVLEERLLDSPPLAL